MTRKPRLDPKERDIQATCEDLLQLDGWRIFRMEQNFSERKIKTVGEAGMPDCLAIRYLYAGLFGTLQKETVLRSYCELMWIEWKRLKGKPSTHQKLWHAAERKRGALVWLAGEEFPATVEGFWAHYSASGLLRNPSIKLGVA